MAIDKRFECPDCGKLVLNLWNHDCTALKPLKASDDPPKPKQPPPHPNKALPRPAQLMGALTDRPKVKPEKLVDGERVPVGFMMKRDGRIVRRKERLSTDRVRAYRERDPEKAKAVQRNYMKRWRSE